MALTLTIENYTSLPDGGPLSYTVTGARGFDLGRDTYLDWTLPDPTRYVSGKHCEVRYQDGDYVLYDVSTNGTFLNGSERRMHGPHVLRSGDRILIGSYIIAVSVDSTGRAVHPPPAVPPAPYGADIWESEGAAPPASRSEIVPRPSSRPTSPDVLDWAIDLPPVAPLPPAPEQPRRSVWVDSSPTGAWALQEPRAVPPPPSAAPAPMAPAADSFVPVAGAPPPASPHPVSQNPASPSRAAAPFAAGAEPDVWDGGGFQSAPAGSPSGTSPDAPVAQPGAAAPSPPFPPEAQSQGFAPGEPQPAEPAGRPSPQEIEDALVALARGAGMPVDAFSRRDSAELFEEVGAVLRVVAENMMRLLVARSSVKRSIRSSEHTTIAAVDNSPFKFSPSVEDSLRIAFGPPVRSYLSGRTAFQRGFEDIANHQLRVFSAMQQALKMLMEDLDPASIEEACGQDKGMSSLLASRKGRLWDLYTTTWRAKTQRSDDGMVGLFMTYFAECYDKLGQFGRDER